MHPDIEALRPQLKAILYDCAVEIRATKAALYLFDGTSRFQLAAEFGFKVPIREWADTNDPLVDRCGRGRTAFYVNGLAEEPRFSELLYETQTERLLVVPIWMRGQLVGMIDMRDKGGRQPFDASDLPKAQKIAERISAQFVNRNVFGQRFIALSSADESVEVTRASIDQSSGRMETGIAAGLAARPAAPSPSPHPPADSVAVPPRVNQPPAPPRVNQPPAPPPAASPPAPPAQNRAAVPTAPAPPQSPPQEARSANVPRLSTLVLESRTRTTGLLVPIPDDGLRDPEMAVIRESLQSTLAIPGVVAALFSMFGVVAGMQEVVARAPLSEEATNHLQSRLNLWLTKRGERGSGGRIVSQLPLVPSASPIEVATLQKIFTAPVNAAPLTGMYLTVAFSGEPDRNAHELLARNLNQLQVSIEHSLNRTSLRSMRLRTAEKLLEPDFTTYPELRRHTDGVVNLVDRFARELELSSAEADHVHLVAMVHDVGMRLIEYDRLYRKREMTADEIQMLHEHVFVGAAIVEPLLGPEVARAVLCHHEWVDGRGYPHELHGDEIPFAARLLQICDAFMAITDPHSYQPPSSDEAALSLITRSAGYQFHAELAAQFVSMIRSGRGV